MANIVKFKIIDESKIEILEDAKAGDIIDLNNVETFDIKTKLYEEIKIRYKKELDENYKQKIENELNKIKNELNQKKYDDIKKIQDEYANEKNKLIREKDKLLNDYKNLKDSFDEKIEYSKKESELLKNQEILLLKELHNNEINKWKELEFEKNIEIDKLKRSKSNNNVKLIGEDLENWCLTQYFNQQIESTTFVKINNLNENKTKADFLFTGCYESDDNVIVKVIIEAKSHNPNSSKTKKNHDYYEKLEKERVLSGSDFGLLVSELEDSIDFYISKANDPKYKYIYVVRPAYMMIFLNMVYSLAIARNRICKEIKSSDNFNFKNYDEIFSEFENFKDQIFINLNEIIKDEEEIKKHTKKIIDAANKIDENKIKKHIEQIKKNIQNFSLNKLLSKTND